MGDVEAIIAVIAIQLLRWILAGFAFRSRVLIEIPGLKGAYSKSNVLGTILGKGIGGEGGVRLERPAARGQSVFVPCRENAELLWGRLIDRMEQATKELGFASDLEVWAKIQDLPDLTTLPPVATLPTVTPIVAKSKRKRTATQPKQTDEQLPPDEALYVDALLAGATARAVAMVPPTEPVSRHERIMAENDRLIQMKGYAVLGENPDAPDYGEYAQDQKATKAAILDRQAVHRLITDANDVRAAEGRRLLAESWDDPQYNEGVPAQDQDRARRAFQKRTGRPPRRPGPWPPSRRTKLPRPFPATPTRWTRPGLPKPTTRTPSLRRRCSPMINNRLLHQIQRHFHEQGLEVQIMEVSRGLQIQFHPWPSVEGKCGNSVILGPNRAEYGVAPCAKGWLVYDSFREREFVRAMAIWPKFVRTLPGALTLIDRMRARHIARQAGE